MRSYLCLISAATCTLLVATEGAFASTPDGAGAVAAVGAPALLVIGGASWPFAIFGRGASKFVQDAVCPGSFGAIRYFVVLRMRGVLCVHICM